MFVTLKQRARVPVKIFKLWVGIHRRPCPLHAKRA
jgi:hypothetical protein